MSDDTRRITGYEILAMRHACEEMEPYKRQDCPVCGWMLRISMDDITECPLCGWTDQNQLRREVDRF